MNAYAATFSHMTDVLMSAARVRVQTLPYALRRCALRGGWNKPYPPIDRTDNAVADGRLADLFRSLFEFEDPEMQKSILHAHTQFTEGMPPNDPFQTVVRRWWLDIDREQNG